MAAGKLPAPGTPYGACKDRCMHRDCIAMREMANTRCPVCKKEIGYETLFYDEGTRLVHAACLEKKG